ncbi:MAG TPA: hypothetical protein PKH65_00875 [Bacteroidia bacterium]|nr:hypothetical protein [Bacteroidia bacterium]HNT79205.1 hypothetical protein [Bacteroidia bacterium]
MESLKSKQKQIKIKVEKLISLHSELAARNKLLEQENNQLKKELDVHKNQADKMHEQNKIIKLAKAISDKGNSKDIKRMINEYIREIDKCIAILDKE